MSENTEQTVDMSRIEELLVDLNKSLNAQQEAAAEAEVDNSVEIIAKGADAIIAQNKEAVEALTKGLDTVLEKLDSISTLIERMGELEAKLDKGLVDLAAVPAAPKSVVAEPEVSPADVTPEAIVADITKGAIMDKALTELRTAQGDRKHQLLKGIAMLDSNFNPADVARDLNL